MLEGSPQIGGKLRVSEVAGVPVDEGAESLLLRRPEAVDLARPSGWATTWRTRRPPAAAIWSRGEMRPLPAGTVMGVPVDLRALARDRAAQPARARPGAGRLVAARRPVGDDVASGATSPRRMGRAVVDRLVEPLLGGVYAGRADELSLDATLPAARGAGPPAALAARRGPARRAARGTRRRRGGLRRAARRSRSAAGRGRAARPAATVRTGATVRELRRDAGRLGG